MALVNSHKTTFIVTPWNISFLIPVLSTLLQSSEVSVYVCGLLSAPGPFSKLQKSSQSHVNWYAAVLWVSDFRLVERIGQLRMTDKKQ